MEKCIAFQMNMRLLSFKKVKKGGRLENEYGRKESRRGHEKLKMEENMRDK